MNAPGKCIDCGNEAYIKLAGDDERMVCAHCYDNRQRDANPRPARPPEHAPAR